MAVHGGSWRFIAVQCGAQTLQARLTAVCGGRVDGKTYVSHFLRRADHEGGKVKNGAVASVEYASFFLVPPGFVWVPPKIRASPNFRATAQASAACAAPCDSCDGDPQETQNDPFLLGTPKFGLRTGWSGVSADEWQARRDAPRSVGPRLSVTASNSRHRSGGSIVVGLCVAIVANPNARSNMKQRVLGREPRDPNANRST